MSLILLKSMLFSSETFDKKILRKKSQVCQDEDMFKCRICNQEKASVPIFENSHLRNIPKEIETVSGVAIQKFGNISNNMCDYCLNLLNDCIIFREMCQKSYQRIMEKMKVDHREDTDYASNNKESASSKQNDSDDVASFNSLSSTIPQETNTEIIICEACRHAFHDITSYGIHKCEKPKKPEKVKRVRNIKEQRKKVLCNICGHVTFCNALLKIHMNVHQNLFPFKCDKCPYKSSSMSLLRVHIRVHSEEKAYKCLQCPFATKTSGNLSKHVRHRHTDSRPFKCQHCDKVFAFQHEVNQHVKHIHLRERVECEICHKHFSTRKNLLKHQRIIHKICGTEKYGRLPSYLRVAMEEQNENNVSEFVPS